MRLLLLLALVLVSCDDTQLYRSSSPCLCDDWAVTDKVNADGSLSLVCWSYTSSPLNGLCTVDECLRCFSVVDVCGDAG